ncbi:kazrin-like isoform X2 [Erpetoichthys calabaricus]|uniref:kazrin-like isoform X2 n=1 Tax=Erpetoichthys calabaricus TaxID=27687 RepID=UPI002234C8F9|nr:kazrin-like isoform X2 [Erpetoichthys calabaricus]
MSQWKARTVQAWLEVIIAMPMYVRSCAKNVKSGKVLLGLTDEDLEFGLGICNTLHRRKLQLAIEDYQLAESSQRLSNAADLDHHWVAKAWLCDIGLPQYSQNFLKHLVDGRVLRSLTRRDLEKHLSITKKFHQVSILLGIELLSQAHCDKEEYADNLEFSGVHGAVLVLEPAFNAEALASALHIPSHRHILRRHLSEELKVLITSNRESFPADQDRQGLGGPTSWPGVRHTEEERAVKCREGKPPVERSSRVFTDKDLGFHGNRSSLPHDSNNGKTGRPHGSSMDSLASSRVTNV